MCASSLHLNFANDANHTLWIGNLGSDVVGWLNTKMFDETHDAEKSQGWSPLVLDTNGNGKRDDYTEPGQPTDPNKDTRIKGGYYGIVCEPRRRFHLGDPIGLSRRAHSLHPRS